MRQSALAWMLGGMVIATAGCGTGDRPREAATGERAPSSEATESERLDSQAQDFEARYREIREGEGSDQEKAEAVSRLADEQQRALRDAADGGADASQEREEGEEQ